MLREVRNGARSLCRSYVACFEHEWVVSEPEYEDDSPSAWPWCEASAPWS